VPCSAVKRGVLRYYLSGLAAEDDPNVSSGSPREPFFVVVRSKIAGAAPKLPGARPPKSCDECGSEATVCGAGDEESSESEATPQEGGAERPVAPGVPRGYVRWWVGFSGSVDLVSLPSGNDVCKLNASAAPANAQGYYCTVPDGVDFPSRASTSENDSLAPGGGGTAAGGITGRDVRLMATLDYATSASFLLGVRVGYVLNGYQGQAAIKDGHAFSLPLHLELRATYLFGDEPLAHSGLAPYAFASGGAAEFDAQTRVMVTQSGIAGQRPVQAWRTAGPLFFALGGGARYAFSARAGFLAGIRATAALGGAGGLMPTFAPELAFQYGF
jgi:hypothetical protein